MYHCVGTATRKSRFNVPPERFAEQMKFLSDHRYRVISLDTFLNALTERASLPLGSVVLTFDDGFQDTFDYAYPVLKQFGYTATFFLVTRLMSKTNEWMRQGELENGRLMGWKEARQLLAEGHCLGSHTNTHPMLPEISARAAKTEIEDSKLELEDRLGVPVRFFAYPYGRFNPSVREFVCQAGYAAACSTQAGFNAVGVDPYALRRLDIYGTASMGTFRRNLIFGENQMTSARLAVYYARRAIARIASQRR